MYIYKRTDFLIISDCEIGKTASKVLNTKDVEAEAWWPLERIVEGNLDQMFSKTDVLWLGLAAQQVYLFKNKLLYSTKSMKGIEDKFMRK